MAEGQCIAVRFVFAVVAAVMVAGCFSPTSHDGVGNSNDAPGQVGIVETTSDNRENPELPSPAERGMLPDCEGAHFRTIPVDLDEVTEITPIGNLAPPGHTFPTDHPFIHFHPGGYEDTEHALAAPADVTLLHISYTHGSTQDPVDYVLYFALCSDIVGYYNHVKTLAPEIQGLIDNGECLFNGETKESRCSIRTFHPITDGAHVGTVGGLQGNFDFGLIDLRTTNYFANPDRYSERTLHIQCAFDYYDTPSRQEFYDLIQRRVMPICGQNHPDGEGTIAGNWVHETTKDAVLEWNKHLSFAYDNENPSQQVISIGGVASAAGLLYIESEFGYDEDQPTYEASPVNPIFWQVEEPGVYCFEGTGIDGRLLVEVVDDGSIKVEHQENNCAQKFDFESPHRYIR